MSSFCEEKLMRKAQSSLEKGWEERVTDKMIHTNFVNEEFG